MKYLQWSTNDLISGLGGVEVHARCLDRELKKINIQSHIAPLKSKVNIKDWDLIHTHGDGLTWSRLFLLFFYSHFFLKLTWVHTLHGSTLGRMFACKEFFWLRGYLIALKEIVAAFLAKKLFSVHGDLVLYRISAFFRTGRAICSNGYDSYLENESSPIPNDLEMKLESKFFPLLYIGRGNDKVKAVERLIEVLDSPEVPGLIAIPGDGFENVKNVYPSGRLSPQQISEVLKKIKVLLLCSHYEGLPLVILEALASGVSVVSTQVGGITNLPEGLKGFQSLKSFSVHEFKELLLEAVNEDFSEDELIERKKQNQALLLTWAQVAKRIIDLLDQ